MNSSRHEPRPDAAVIAAADAVITTVPRAMRQIRGVARSATFGLSVPQFRALRYLARHPGSGLTPVAEHLGVSLPAASALVGRLAAAGLLARENDPQERRRIVITLTARGQERIAASNEAVETWWRGRLAALSTDQLTAITEALGLLDASIGETDVVPEQQRSAVVA